MLVAALGLVAADVLQDSIERRARDRLVDQGRTIAVGLVAPALGTADLTAGRGLPFWRYDDVNRAVLQGLADLPVHGVSVRAPDGTVVYDDRAGLVGTRPAVDDGLRAALDGQVAATLEPAGDVPPGAEDPGDVLEVVVPVRRTVGGAPGTVVAAVEVSLPYGPTQQMVREDVMRLLTVLGVGLVVLWVSLWHLVRRAARRLREQHEHTEWLARHDPLTGLANRVRFGEEVDRAVRTGRTASLLVLDLNRFRDVNDTFGHVVGDAVLAGTAQRLAGAVGPQDVVARLGGDEFAVLVPDDEDGGRAERIADRVVRDVTATPFLVDELALDLDVCVGIARMPRDAEDVDSLVRCAEAALHEAKRDQVAVRRFRADMGDTAADRLVLFGDLRRAIVVGDIDVHLQPSVELATGRVVALEALARWHHPERGPVPPDVFVPLAEQTGLVPGLTRHVLRRSLAALVAVREHVPGLGVAVNLSALDLVDPGLCDTALEVCREHGVSPRDVEFEITETSAMRDRDRSLRVLGELRDAGFSLAIDDYGTGHSSLAYLRSLPVTTIKIDRAFLVGLDDPDNEAIVRSTVGLGTSLGLRVVAEGVEDERAHRLLREMGCHHAQGYWFGRPVPARRVPAAVAEVHARTGVTTLGPVGTEWSRVE